MESAIKQRLRNIEKTHDVQTFYAVESGSRAWGASPNCDRNVRFIYTHSQGWYLDINFDSKPDIIGYKIVDDIDIHRWDTRKAKH